jgi:hypothetical protein
MCKLAICSAPVTPRSAWIPSVSSGDATQEESAPDTLRSPVSADVSGERPIVVTIAEESIGVTIDRMLDSVQLQARINPRYSMHLPFQPIPRHVLWQNSIARLRANETAGILNSVIRTQALRYLSQEPSLTPNEVAAKIAAAHLFDANDEEDIANILALGSYLRGAWTKLAQ